MNDTAMLGALLCALYLLSFYGAAVVSFLALFEALWAERMFLLGVLLMASLLVVALGLIGVF